MTEIVLHNWQKQALKEWINNKGQGIIQAPTGAGKTYLGLKLMEKDSLFPFLVITPTIELKEQWKRRIQKFYPNITIRGIGGGEKYNPNKTLDCYNKVATVAVINSMRDQPFSCKTVILDEIHHYSILAPVNFKIWDNVDYRYIMGLSATPVPERLARIGGGWDIPLVYRYTLSQAYRDKILLRPEIVLKPVNLTESEQERYDMLTEKMRNNTKKFVDFDDAPVWFKACAFERNEILFNSRMKFKVLEKILSEVDFQKAIIFTERIETAEIIARRINEIGIEALALHSELKKKERKELVSRFINTSFPIVLVNAHIFEEGLDVPQVDLLLLYSYNSTRRENLQRIGRVLHNRESVPKIFILYYRNTKETKIAKKIKRFFESFE
ncbi:MAG: hypothetical protein DRP18_03075 [Candidatus Aenigmatarchaeota archaeon]|nr:MAG: hypothetical protein DRP18_03075 [Candidatus Aenigmarchaeota archaeon]